MIRNIRRAIQILFLIFFLFLLLMTVFPVNFIIPVDLILRLDPLSAIATMLASRSLITKFSYSMVTVIVSIFFGRFFCGWICPLGTTIDISDKIFFRRFKRPKVNSLKLRNFKYYMLLLFIVGAIFSLQLIWLADPLSIATKSYEVVLYPYISYATNSTFNALYQLKGINTISEPIYGFLRKYLIPNQQNLLRLHLVFFSIFAGIILLNLLQKRFWCSNLCPLGALLGLLAKPVNFFRRTVNDKCIDCGKCQHKCNLNAISEDPKRYWVQECTNCMTCVDVCPTKAISFKIKHPFADRTERVKLDLSKRAFIRSAIGGIATVPLLKLNYRKRYLDETVIRPPGALPEEQFLDKCIRCGKCMKVCPTNGLQPTFLEAGVEGIGTPILVPRIGQCEYICVSCTRVCPTNAITELSEEEKKKVKIGTARIDITRCIPWSEYEDCLVCEEQCPIPTKAIKFEVRDVILFNGDVRRIKFPVVLKDKCIGCGICENKCPVKPKAAIAVTSQIPGKRWNGGITYSSDVSRMESPGPQSIDRVEVLKPR